MVDLSAGGSAPPLAPPEARLEPPLPSDDPRNASDLRVALSTMFALSGFVFASWAVRVPDLTEQVGASHASLGITLLCVSLGALATMRITGTLSDRLGPGLMSVVAAVLLCFTVVAPGLAHSVTGLGAVLLAFGAATGMLNVAMNSMGVRLEAATGRPLLPSLHAAFSFGGLGGSVAGGVVASTFAPVQHFLSVACLALAVVYAISGRLLAGDETLTSTRRDDSDAAARGMAGTRPVVIALGVVAGCTAFGEGALSDWGALHLTLDLAAPPVVAAAAYAGFSLAMACGRLGGHWLVETLGETRLLVSGALLAAAGMLLVALPTVVTPTLVGFLLVGLGLSNIFPIAIARAGDLAGGPGVGLASTVGYGGLLAGPALIGLVAAHTGLPVALLTVSGAAIIAAGLAVAIRGNSWSSLPSLTTIDVAFGARMSAWVSPIGRDLGAAAQRHLTELNVLLPGPVTVAGGGSGRSGGPERSQPRRASFVDLQELLGRHAAPQAA